MAKTETILPLIKPISKEESPYTDIFDRRDPAGIDKVAEMPGRSKDTEMPGRSEDTEMPDVKHIPREGEHTTSGRSRSGIQSIQSVFKLIEFNDSKRTQAGEPVDEEITMAYMADILIE